MKKEFRLTQIVCTCGTEFFVGYDDNGDTFLECGNIDCPLMGKRFEPPAVELKEINQ